MKDPRRNMRESAYIKRFVEERFTKAKAKLEKIDIPQENKDLLKKYIQYHMGRGSKMNTIGIYLEYLTNFSVIAKKPFREITKDDMIQAMIEINNRYATTTINDYRTYVKGFYKWMNNGRVSPTTSWIKTDKYIPTVRYNDLVFKEHIEEMLKFCKNKRDTAAIAFLWESGCRLGELLTMRIKDISFEMYNEHIFASVDVYGKTGHRTIFISPFAAKPLYDWLLEHPHRAIPDQWVYVSVGRKNFGKSASYTGFRTVLKKIEEDSLIGKNLYPHLFRHSAATRDAVILTEPEMCMKFGWTPGSVMPAFYIHLNGSSIKKKVIENYMQKMKRMAMEEMLIPVIRK